MIRAIDAGEPFDRIENVSTALAVNPMRRLIETLDELPHPDRELVYFPGGHLAALNVKSFMCTRGCAYRCAYCFKVVPPNLTLCPAAGINAWIFGSFIPFSVFRPARPGRTPRPP